MRHESKLVSVVIPTHNRGGVIGRAIQSALDQTYQTTEIVVVDDCSDDETEKVVGQFRDPRLRYLRHSVNLGGNAARNSGLREARGNFVAFLDDDDEWLPGKLSEQVRVFEQSEDKRLGFVYCGAIYVDDHGRSIRKLPRKRGNVFKELLRTNIVVGGGSSNLIRKDIFDDVGFFDEDPALRSGGGQEYEMWIRIARDYHFDFSKAFLMKYFIHAGSISHRSTKLYKARAHEYIVRKFQKDYRQAPKSLSDQLTWIGTQYCRSGDMRNGKKVLRKAAKANPLNLRSHIHLLLSLAGPVLYPKIFRVSSKVYHKIWPMPHTH